MNLSSTLNLSPPFDSLLDMDEPEFIFIPRFITPKGLPKRMMNRIQFHFDLGFNLLSSLNCNLKIFRLILNHGSYVQGETKDEPGDKIVLGFIHPLTGKE
jgi:hypothetical protein